ncbi:Phage protein [Devosia sp. DBB001]|nr:Phage protein [Devosia sp. DBB001]
MRPKLATAGVQPFVLNKAQVYLHGRLEAQRERTGRVRALVLKGRQQGISTYIGGRFYHRATHSKGVRVFILTHEQDATDNLFGMVERYHEHCPPLVKPSTGAANAKELYFDRLDSGYGVGTAGAKAKGRSQTIQLFHGSEVAFWPNAKAHFSGVVQAVPDEPGTEIILESTANGIGGEFHSRWQDAEAGRGDYEAIFIPWYWQDEYTRPVPNSFVLNKEEQDYFDAYRSDGLTMEHMVWRRAKLIELNDPTQFKQEYPATAAEAFQMSGHDSYIKPEAVVKARKADLEGIGPLIIGADPARFGDDRFSLVWRRGRKVIKVESRQKIDTVAGANWLKQVIDADNPDRVFIDVGGVGAGVYDILKSWGEPYASVVVPIDFSGSPQAMDIILPSGEKRPGPFNRRAEMWMRSRDWLDDSGGADIPDLDSLQADACGPGYHYNANSYLLMESKEHMREVRRLRSPDEWDAVVLTFAEPVAPRRTRERPAARGGSGSWMN